MNDRSQTSAPRRTPRQRSRLPALRVTLPAEATATGSRLRILNAALQLFAGRGFHATSVRDLAGKCRLQPGALYVHFPSKEHILAELCQIGHEVHHQALRTALLDAGSEPEAQIRAVVRAHVRVHATHPQLAVLINEELYTLPSELAAPALTLRTQSTALLTEILARGVALQRFRCRDLRVTAAAISAMGLRIPYWYRPDEGPPLDTLAEIHAELSLRMLGVPT